MKGIYKSSEGRELLRRRYEELLPRWPVPYEVQTIATAEGDTGVITCGTAGAPPLVLLHGSVSNSLMWIGDVAHWAPHFRIHAVDLIGEAGLSAESRPDHHSAAYAHWLDEVFAGLGVVRPALVGISLGGWLALDYAIRRPGTVRQLALMCPAGVGTQRRGFFLKVLFYLLLGSRGRERLRERIMGPPVAEADPGFAEYMGYLAQVQQHFRPRIVRFDLFTDAMLQTLEMPLLAIVGGQDPFFDAAEIRDRLARHVAGARVIYREELGHMIAGQSEVILQFLLAAPGAEPTTESPR